tara:strand:+ start:1764 stop:2645 length:882 start_codon:yes stop_codon:yes gene_type:complete
MAYGNGIEAKARGGEGVSATGQTEETGMREYLDKIRAGQPINYEAFLKRLPAAVRARQRRLFRSERVAPNRWRVQVLDEGAFAELEAWAAPARDRTEAAAKGDSHRSRTRHTFLLVYHEQRPSGRPDTLVLSETAVDCGFEPKRQVLVVENEDNFFAFRTMLAFAAREAVPGLDLSNCDVVLGGGKRVTRRSCLDWLDRYERVYCALDYDAGGLEIFATIRTHLGDKAGYLQPRDWSAWYHRFRRTPARTARFARAIRLAEDLGFDSLARAFRATGKFMEQEMILDERPAGDS